MRTFFTLLLTACACFGQLIIKNQAQNIAPSISTQPTNQTIVTNANASFTVVATGTPTLYYQWQTNSVDASDGGRISGATSNVLTFTAATIDDSNTPVRCIITNAYGSVTSSVATLTVTNSEPAAPVITAISSNGLSSNSVTITWTTDISTTNDYVYFSTDTSYNLSSNSTAGGTSHSILLSNLTASTTYNFKVASWAGGLSSTSSPSSFTTTSGAASFDVTNAMGGWWIADNFYTNGSTRTVLPDISGLSRDMTDNAFSEKLIPFTRSNHVAIAATSNSRDMRLSSITNSLPLEFWWVGCITNKGGSTWLIRWNLDNNGGVQFNADQPWLVAWPSPATYTWSTTNTWQVFTVYYTNNGKAYISVNNGTPQSGGSTAYGMSSFRIGDSDLDGGMAYHEILCYTNLNTDADRLKIYQYLTNKYSLAP